MASFARPQDDRAEHAHEGEGADPPGEERARPDGADARESRGARPQASPERGDAPGFAVAARHDQESPSPGDGDQGQGVVPCLKKRSACTTWRPLAVRIATASGSAVARDRAPARRRARATRASRRGRATMAMAGTSRT